jgi:uncharacterized protein
MNWLVIPIAFGAIFIQSIAGFGSALVAMPFLIAILGPDTARPAFAIATQFTGFYFLYQYRAEWNWRTITPLIIGSLVGIPLGFYVAVLLDKETFMLLLGIITISYALYSLSGLTMPELKQRWGLGFGFFSGLFHAAYNLGGSPLVIYGLSQRWKPTLFKCNIAIMFFVMGIFIVAGHFQQGNITTEVLQNVALMTPTMFIAMFAGFSLDRFIKPKPFRIAVSLLLVIVGLRLIFG